MGESRLSRHQPGSNQTTASWSSWQWTAEVQPVFWIVTPVSKRGSSRGFHFGFAPTSEHDAQLRVPDVRSARKARKVLESQATTYLSEMLDEVIPWICQEVKARRL